MVVVAVTGATGEVVGTAGRATVLGACALLPAVAVTGADASDDVELVPLAAGAALCSDALAEGELPAVVALLPDGAWALSGLVMINAIPMTPAMVGRFFI